MTVRWLLFDVGDVLEVTGDGDWPASWARRFAERLGMSNEEFDGRVALAELPAMQVRTDVEDEYWRRFAAAVGAGQPLMDRMVTDFWDAYCGTLNTELVEFARSLRGTVGLAILSNSADGARREEELRHRFSATFDPIIYSHEIGVLKPDPAAYAAALEAMGASAAEVLFVDNSPVHVEGARRCGITALVHEDNATTITAIRQTMGN
ncbi:HAD-IA family hydrolase [Knoellia koreensis]|uniref:HAD-IA family hydrolase n=1 Tax=Knoellia koreensis TaxID=2730921 RepID=UPI003211CFF8